MEALERTKDEEAKKFQSHNIHFDFNILVKIKEALVDVSSSCMELALKVLAQSPLSTSESESLLGWYFTGLLLNDPQACSPRASKQSHQ